MPLLALLTTVNGVAEELFFRGALYAAIPRHPVLVTTAAYAVALLFGSNAISEMYVPAPSGCEQFASAVALVELVALVRRQRRPLSVPAISRSELPGAIA